VNVLIWRLHRNQVYFALGALVVVSVLLLVTGMVMRHDYSSALAACTAVPGCADLPASSLFRGDGAIIDLVDLTIVVPLLFGLFWGAPLLSKEFEDGTHNLAWTQGVSRRRWLRANIGWSLCAAALWGAALAALVTYWRFPENAVNSRFQAFDIQGIVPVAYALFAVALGIAVGSVLRRVLPSLAVTLAVFVALRAVIGVYLRPHLMSPITKLFPPVGPTSSPVGAWVLSTSIVNGRGQVLQSGYLSLLGHLPQVPADCRGALLKGKSVDGQCFASHGFHQLVTYQPDSRFWAFQGMEAGIFLVLALASVGFAWWWVQSRDA
jgi:hypothetical protein